MCNYPYHLDVDKMAIKSQASLFCRMLSKQEMVLQHAKESLYAKKEKKKNYKTKYKQMVNRV